MRIAAKHFDDIDESGYGVYIKNKSCEALPLEAYYIFKNESDWNRMEGTNSVPVADLDLDTVGVRLMPEISETVGGNLEVAYQFGERGDRDVEGMMVDAALNWHMPVLKSAKPTLSAGYYYLSGDDPSTADDEGWNPLWARWPQYSELYVYAFDAENAGRWSNVTLTHIDLSLASAKNLKVKAMAGILSAPENNGPGMGDERGVLYTCRADFNIGQKLVTDRDKLTGHLIAEVLDPGDYYNVDDTAHFLRWEFIYAF